MKKFFIAALCLIAGMVANAQNIQLHYDFGRHIYNSDIHGRQDLTLTVEQFKADNLGQWYYFIDIDIDKNGVFGGYTEVSREFTFAKPSALSSFAGHMEFDGGLSRNANSFQSALLAGASWNWHNIDFSRTFSVQALYKQFLGQNGSNGAPHTHAFASFQLTGVWGIHFAGGKMTFSGFADLWRGERANHHGCLVFLTEPQLWYNFNKHFSAGTEVEMSNNFIFKTCAPFTCDKFYINPTVAVKYNF